MGAIKQLAEERVTGGFYLRGPNPFERAASIKPITRGDIVRGDLEEGRGKFIGEPAQELSVNSPVYGAAPFHVTRADHDVVRSEQLEHRGEIRGIVAEIGVHRPHDL